MILQLVLSFGVMSSPIMASLYLLFLSVKLAMSLKYCLHVMNEDGKKSLLLQYYSAFDFFAYLVMSTKVIII